MSVSASPASGISAEGAAARDVTGSRRIGWVLTAAGALGLTSSVVLTIEKFAVLTDPGYRPSCSINPVISCGSIMTSWQAELFGFPNPLLGLVGFAVVLTLGVLVLSGVVLPRWYVSAVFVGLSAAVAFVHWLIFQSLYRIEALCPYCMVVWLATVLAWWYTVLHLETAGAHRSGRWREAACRLHSVPPTLWVLAVLVLITEAFWPYWSTLL